MRKTAPYFKRNMKELNFREKVLPVLHYVGIIGASVASVAYIFLVVVLINGFKADKALNTTVFAIINAAVGFIIMQFLKFQGISFAEMEPENVEILKQYYNTKTKDKKNHSLTYFWATTVVKDILVKCGMLAISTFGIIYLVIVGSKDYNLLLLAFVNLLLFICFGFLSLVKSYNYFNRTYIPYIKEKMKEKED